MQNITAVTIHFAKATFLCFIYKNNNGKKIEERAMPSKKFNIQKQTEKPRRRSQASKEKERKLEKVSFLSILIKNERSFSFFFAVFLLQYE